MASAGDRGLYYFDDGNSGLAARRAEVVKVVSGSLVVNVAVEAFEDDPLLTADEQSSSQPTANGNPIPRIVVQRSGVSEVGTPTAGGFKVD